MDGLPTDLDPLLRRAQADHYGLPDGPYDVILADPPWAFKTYSAKGLKKSPQSKYGCMSVGDLAMFPAESIAAKNCLLFMWATWPILSTALATMSAWGFRYKTGGAWAKRTVRGKWAFGTGYILRSASEPFLIGTRGKVSTVSRSERGLIEAAIREHSRKPDEVYGLIERLCPYARKIELFARQRWPGWDAWGDEVGVFEGETA